MKPLEGITVLDLARVLAAPYATMLLAEMGATVIKVEQPGTGDEIRFYEPMVKGESAYYFTANRSKKSITANLRNAKAQQMVRDLAAGADVVVENFTVGTLKRYGLDYDSIAKVNPKIVYLSVTGFGQDGPYAARRGYDTVFQAMTGMVSLTGERGAHRARPGCRSPTCPRACGRQSPCCRRCWAATPAARARISTSRCSMARSAC